MPHRRFALTGPLAVALALAAWQAPQEPKPAAADEAKAPVGMPPRHALEGVYELRNRMVGGQLDPRPSRGYLAFTQRHMFLCLVGPGPDPDEPLLRAGVRTWTPRDELVQTTVKLGYFTDESGTIHVEKAGTEETRRVRVERGRIRVHQDDRSYLEFERIE